VTVPRRPVASRLQAIADQLRANGSVTVAEVEERFGISPVTARRDLAELERRGVVRRTHGGAVLPAAPDLQRAEGPADGGEHLRRIAEIAVGLLGPRETVFLDSSAASEQIARRILDTGIAVTLLTNGVRVIDLVFSHAGPEVDLIGLGGSLSRATGSFVGPATVAAIAAHFADRLFLGVSGITPAGMLTERDPLEAEIKRAMLGQAAQTTLLLDPDTLTGHGLVGVAALGELAAAVCAGVAAVDLEPLRAAGVALHV
jgi:DeoR/GlpR family transcriptional regulator of sugar metabolism